MNFALFLTLIRLVASLTLLPALYLLVLPLHNNYLNFLVGIIFALFALTDGLDGYIARKYRCQTDLGAILDPLSDKLLLLSSLFFLVWLKKVFFYWGIIFLAREFIVTTFRQVAALSGQNIPVSYSGKIKACLQMAYIFIVIIKPEGTLAFGPSLCFNLIESSLLILSLAATLYSGYIYSLSFLNANLIRSKIK